MLASLLVGCAVLLWLAPYCLSELPRYQRLWERAEPEQSQSYRQLFRTSPVNNWWWRNRLQQDRRLRENMARLAGLDLPRTGAALSRLRSPVSVEEVLLARLAGLGILLGLLVYTAFRYVWQGALATVDVLPLLAGFALYMAPTWLVDWLDRRAKQQIRAQVPVFFSIVLALVEAGMPIAVAVMETARRTTSRLGRELASLELEEKQSGNWRKALEELAFHWEVDSLIAIAAEINEALTKGTPIAERIAQHIEEQLRVQEDETSEQVSRLTVRLLPLLIVCMGVPLLFLVVGPSLVGIRQLL